LPWLQGQVATQLAPATTAVPKEPTAETIELDRQENYKSKPAMEPTGD
jgi:hypothetical protein